jgi:alpha-N-arabinofuranosidase
LELYSTITNDYTMKKRIRIIGIILVAFLTVTYGQERIGKVVINADLGEETISRHIYGHFSEHLGRCIYGGYWVGEGSDISNTRGIRNDVVEALKATGIPNLRWPGGCFADEYHWRDGIGPRDTRPTMVNTHWGGVTEDNSFGTHEFLDLCEQLDAEPVICGNVGSGSVEEMSDWVEYINFEGVSPLADLRRVNGREEPWNVRYWGIGNENWGCGGHMTAEFYADQYRRYATYCRSYGNRLMKIAGGASDVDYHWTETLMKNIPHRMMYGISLHHYTTNWDDMGPATGFGEDEYMDIIRRCLEIEEVIDKHMTIMDQYDPEKRVALVVDEWGAWHRVEEGTNPGFLYQQNSLRDAMVAALSLNYFNERCERIKMANLAQTVNVLQAMILTDGAKMLKTPTYHVFDMYKAHHDAILVPVYLETPDYQYEDTSVPMLSVSASRSENGTLHVSIVNVDPQHESQLNMDLRGIKPGETSGRILTAGQIDSHNTFDAPEQVKPDPFKVGSPRKGILDLTIPAKSIVVLEIQPEKQ